MEKLIEKLNNPFDGLNANDKSAFQKKCAELAKKLFNNYYFQCGEKKYYCVEIEFYYYDEDHFNLDWNEVTYERDGYETEDIFYHLSGMDICFNSHLLKQKGKKVGYGGGILIRSIMEIVDMKKEITVGPLTCVNKMLNACKGEKMPKIVFAPKQRNCIPKETYRYLGKNDFKAIPEKKNKDGELKLAYYDSSLSEKEWNKARSSYYKNRLVNIKEGNYL